MEGPKKRIMRMARMRTTKTNDKKIGAAALCQKPKRSNQSVIVQVTKTSLLKRHDGAELWDERSQGKIYLGQAW